VSRYCTDITHKLKHTASKACTILRPMGAYHRMCVCVCVCVCSSRRGRWGRRGPMHLYYACCLITHASKHTHKNTHSPVHTASTARTVLRSSRRGRWGRRGGFLLRACQQGSMLTSKGNAVDLTITEGLGSLKLLRHHRILQGRNN